MSLLHVSRDEGKPKERHHNCDAELGTVHYGNHFLSKFDERIDAEIDADKIMKIKET